MSVTSTFDPIAPVSPIRVCTEQELRARVEACPKLASLQSTNRALSDLLKNEQGLASQIADVIRRDPSLAARLLRMVNSVYYGLSMQVNDIEEAVFFLGLRQIRELSLATPIIEDLARLQNGKAGTLPWKELWAHSIGTAILTRKILTNTAAGVSEDTAYLAGLLHNVGKVLFAMLFPKEAAQLGSELFATPLDVCLREREIFGWDHGHTAAHYLEGHRFPEEVVIGVRFHNEPARAPSHQLFPAAVQVADHLTRFAGVGVGFEHIHPIEEGSWTQLEGWQILFSGDDISASLARASLTKSLNQLPVILQGLVT
jgi:HD-like signal output (HDOD) protein